MAQSTTLAEHFAALAAADPDRPAITCAGSTVTRRELERRTNRLARAYQQLGVTPDSFVTIGLPNTVEFLEAAIAAWKCGATPQPVSYRLPARERRAIIELAEPSLVVGVTPEDAVGHTAIPAGYEPDPGLSDAPLGEVAAASWKAPTSGGSTGRPKLIVSTQAALVESVEPFARLLGMTDGDTVLITGPLYHNAPFLLSTCALVLGGHVVLMPRFDAESALQLVQEHAVDYLYAVPTMMGRIWRLPEEQRLGHDVSSLRVVMHMAAPCPPWLKQAWIDWLGPDRIWELYAATEVQAVTLLTGSEWLRHPGSVGRPVVGELQVLDPAGAPLPAGGDRRGLDAPGPGRACPVPLRRRRRPDDGRRVGVGRRHGLPRRRGLPLPRRPQERHADRGWRQRLPGRGGERADGAPGGAHRGGHRAAPRGPRPGSARAAGTRRAT